VKYIITIIVTNKETADYVLDATNESRPAGWAKILMVNPHSEENASVRLLNKAGEVLFAYSVEKFNSVHGKQSTAEACAKHLKKAMGKN